MLVVKRKKFLSYSFQKRKINNQARVHGNENADGKKADDDLPQTKKIHKLKKTLDKLQGISYN